MAMLQETDSRVVQASIIATSTARDWDGSTFTVYVIKTETETNDAHFLIRRYNQFFRLNEILVQEALLEDGLLPGKKWLFNMDPNYIQERRALLRFYLHKLLSQPKLHAHAEVQRFLSPQLPPHSPQGAIPSFDIEAPDPSASGAAADTIDDVLSLQPSTLEPLPSCSVVPVDSGSSQFGWVNRSIWDPTTSVEMGVLLSEEISRLRANIFRLKDIKTPTERQDAELDAFVDQLKFIRRIVDSKTSLHH